jgi:arylsulfatase A-like enzyme
MLTGQRPDSTGMYNFETLNPTRLLNIPMMFSRNGYTTAGYGKILHHEKNDVHMNWNYEQFNNDWYKVQNTESKVMNASVTPDKNMPEEQFPDHIFTSRAIETIRALVHNNTHAARPKPFMVGVGYKLPHLALHVPFRYFEQYRAQAAAPPEEQGRDRWPYHCKSTADLSYPQDAPVMSYSLSNANEFKYMNEEGASASVQKIRLKNDALLPFPKRAHLEVSFVSHAGRRRILF